MSASSIGAEIDSIEAEAGEHVLETVADVSNGVSIDQAILNRVVAKGTDVAVSAGIIVGLQAVRALLYVGKSVVGFAKIGNALAVPGTILSRTRMIPGPVTGGVVGSGTANVLGNRLLRANGILTKYEDVPNYVAHHLIPVVEARKSKIIQKIGMDIDDATNGILLPTPGVHFGSHEEYSKAITQALDLIPDSLPINEIMDRVYEIQARAANAFAEGKKLSRGNRLSQSDWFSIFTGAI